MTKDPILAEVRRIREELAREANYDLHKLCVNLRRSEATRKENRPSGKPATKSRVR